MKTTYLLPCQCGERFQVDASESGLVKQCHCGATLEVPTLRGLARLEKVVVEEAAPRRPWGGAQRGMVIGGLIAVIGVAMTIYWHVKRLPQPEEFLSPQDAFRLGVPNDLSWVDDHVANVLQLWYRIEAEGLQAPPSQMLEPYYRALEVTRWWRVASYVVAGLGLLVLGISVLVSRLGGSRATAPRQPAAVG
jgi:hypothetical protein